MASLLKHSGIPTTVVLDSAVGHVMESVDMVIVGSEAVVENGGIVNKVTLPPLFVSIQADVRP